MFQTAQAFQRIERSGRRFAVYGGQDHGLQAAQSVVHPVQSFRRQRGVVGQRNLFHHAAQTGGHIAETVAEHSRAHGDHGIAGAQRAFERAPQGQHSLARGQNNFMGRSREFLEIGAGGPV